MTQFLGVLSHLPNPKDVNPDRIITLVLQDEKSWLSDPTYMTVVQNGPNIISGSVMDTIEIRFKSMNDKYIPYWKPEQEITIY